MKSVIFLVFLAVAAQIAVCDEEHQIEDTEIVKAVIESCPGCSLNRLKDVKTFVYDDVPKYENVEFKRISGHPPELVFLNAADEELERIPLSKLNRKECNELLTNKGFELKPDVDKIEL